MPKRRNYPPALLLGLLASFAISRSSFAQDDPWRLFLGIREARILDREVNGIPTADETVDAVNSGLSFGTSTEHSSVGLSGRVGANRRDTRDTNRINYGAAFSWNYETSERSRMTLGQNVSRNFRLDTLANLGVGAEQADLTTLSATTNWGYVYQSSARTSWSTSARYGYRLIDNVEAIDASQIVLDRDPFGDEFPIPDPTLDPGTADLPDAQDDILDILATEGVGAGGQVAQFGAFGLGLNHQLNERTAFGMSVNGSFRSLSRGTGRSNGPRGGAQVSLQRDLSPTHAASVSYSFQRSFVQDPGVTAHTASVGWSYTPRQADVSFSASVGASGFQSGDRPFSFTPVANLSFSAGLTASTTAGISYRRQYTIPTGFGPSRLIDYASASLNQGFGDRVSASLLAGASFGGDPTEESTQFEARRVGGSVQVEIAWGLAAGTTYFYADNERTRLGDASSQSRRNWSYFLNYSTGW